MSRKSTARASSGGGDAEAISHGEVCSNILSDSSSGKGKEELGPYGDSPPDQYKNTKDFYILMYHNNGSTETSDGGDREGFESPDEYMQKLNWVRRQLNLVEIEEDQRGVCKITEITEENVDTIEIKENENDKCEQQKTNKADTEAGKPFLFNGKSESFKEILDLEYNPPKKMSCYRIRTPKFPETSESNIPYHIRVSLNENLFKNVHKMSSDAWQAAVAKFTDTKEVQCDDKEFNETISQSSSSKSHEFKQKINSEVKNLFPNVVIQEPTEEKKAAAPAFRKPLSKNTLPSPQTHQKINVLTDDYVRTIYSPRDYNMNESQVARNISLNYVEDSLDENNVLSSTTTITVSPKSVVEDGNSKKQNIWNQISRLDEDRGESSRRKVKKQRKHWDQYVSYRKERNRAKSSPIKTNHVAYGPVILSHSDLYNLDNNFYILSSSSERQSSCLKSTDEQESSFWKRFFCCFK